MEDSRSLDHQDAIPDESINKEALDKINNELESLENTNKKLNQHKNINLNTNAIHKEHSKILEDNKNKILTSNIDTNSVSSNNKIESNENELIREKTTEVSKSSVEDPNSFFANNKSAENVDKVNRENELEKNKKDILKVKSDGNVDKVNIEKELEKNKKDILKVKSDGNVDNNNTKEISTTTTVKAKAKPVKEPPIEKKPFLEFVNNYLIPEIKNEFKLKGKEVNIINLKKTNRPIADDICWVIYCEVNDTCNFWLSFERDDITSLKSFSLCKNYEKPSIIESFLIDEKKITLKLIISRILQRLNGQKLIGAN